MLKKDQLVAIVSSAFLPLECVAELQNYGHAFGFAVYLPDGSRMVHEENNASLLNNESMLLQIISGVRAKIEAKGIALADWSIPKSTGETT
jgi:hypothetical protein